MQAPYPCPHCRRDLFVVPRHLGQPLRCPAGHHSFTPEGPDDIPLLTAAEDPVQGGMSPLPKQAGPGEGEGQVEEVQGRTRPLRKQRGRVRRLLLWCLGGVTLLVAAVSFVALRWAGDAAEEKTDRGGLEAFTVERSFPTRPDRISTLAKLAVSGDGGVVALSGSEERPWLVYVYDGQTGARLAAYDPHTMHIATVALSPDGFLLAASEDQEVVIGLREARTAELVHKLKRQPQDGERLGHLTFGPRGDVLVAAAGRKVFGWDCKSGRTRFSWEAHGGEVVGLAFQAGGDRLLTCGEDNSVKVWDPATGRAESEVRLDSGYKTTGIEVSPDGRLAATYGYDGRDELGPKRPALRVWDLETGRRLSQLEKVHQAMGYQFLPDNSLAVVHFLDIGVHDPFTGRNKLRQRDQVRNETLNLQKGHDAFQVTADGRLVTFLRDGTIQFLRRK